MKFSWSTSSSYRHPLILLLFLSLWTFVIVRAFTVFYIHDEIVTKWAYMIDWNPFPYQGYIDANNQFLISLLGGFFIRLFQSDAMWIIRLGSILGFPLYFFSIVGFRRYFNQPFSFYFFLISLSCTPFILDFFSLARGYGLAWAFFMWSLLQLFFYLENTNTKNLFLSLIGMGLTLYANLSLLTIVLLLYLLLLLTALLRKDSIQKKWKQVVGFLAFGVLLFFAVEYALNLQAMGKLYMGEASNFYKVTIAPFANYLYGLNGFFAALLFSTLVTFLLISFMSGLFRHKMPFRISNVFLLLLSTSILAILLQNLLLDVNFPENRSATYLLFLFFGSLAFAFDEYEKTILPTTASILIIVAFLTKANFTHTLVYSGNHFDLNLISKIPPLVNGIPASTGGIYYTQDNELSRTHQLPIRAFQAIPKDANIIFDYLVDFKSNDSSYAKNYSSIFIDGISELTLYKRNNFLERKQLFSQRTSFDGTNRFINLIDHQASKAGFFRCRGYFENMTLQQQSTIIFTQENTQNGIKLAYGGVAPVTSTTIDKNGRLTFDFTYAMFDFNEADQMAVYIFNQQQMPLKGEIELLFYEVE